MIKFFVASGVLFCFGSVVPAQVLMNFNPGGATEFVYGSFAGNAFYTTVGGTALERAVRIGGTSVGGGGIENQVNAENWSSFKFSRLRLRASVESGNTMTNFTVYLQETNSPLVYHYSFATSSLSQGQLGWTLGRSLNEPSFVLDSSNNFSFVGAGTGFAPPLLSVSTIGIQSNYVQTNSANRIVFDELQAVPEPASLAILGIGTSLLVSRKRRK